MNRIRDRGDTLSGLLCKKLESTAGAQNWSFAGRRQTRRRRPWSFTPWSGREGIEIATEANSEKRGIRHVKLKSTKAENSRGKFAGFSAESVYPSIHPSIHPSAAALFVFSHRVRASGKPPAHHPSAAKPLTYFARYYSQGKKEGYRMIINTQLR